MNKNFKQDINFLEKPMWVVDETLFKPKKRKRGRQEFLTYVWETGEYTYESALGAPSKFDGMILLYLLMKVQEQNWAETTTLSLYNILKGCSLNRSSRSYERVRESLNLWKNVTVHFKNSFRIKEPDDNGNMFGKYKTLHFSIIDYWGDLRENQNSIEVRFSSLWLDAIRVSKYYKLINFDKYKTLSSPVAARLYEILIKSFEGRMTWKINANKLGEKITIKEKYASEIERKIKASVNQINAKTELQILLKSEKPQRGTCIFTFIKKEKTSNKHKLQNLPDTILNILPKPYHMNQNLLKTIVKALKDHDQDYVVSNIEYSSQRAKDNYPKYLKDALKKGWAPEQKKKIAEVEAIKEFESYSVENLKLLAQAGNKFAQEELKKRIQKNKHTGFLDQKYGV